MSAQKVYSILKPLLLSVASGCPTVSAAKFSACLNATQNKGSECFQLIFLQLSFEVLFMSFHFLSKLSARNSDKIK